MNEIVVRSCKIDDRRLAFPSKLAPLSVSVFSPSAAVGLVIGAIYNCTRKRTMELPSSLWREFEIS